MKLIPLFLLVGMLPLSGLAEPYSPELVKKAEAGNADAQCTLGFLYGQGTGVAKDEKEAVKWFTKAAEQGNANAQCRLGVYYLAGHAVVKDEKEAVKWYTKSAEQGNVAAQYNLGTLYFSGQGVAKDEKEAVKWWTKSAEQGAAFAECRLGFYYLREAGVAKDEKEAVKWFTKAAERGNVDAKKELKKLKSNLLAQASPSVSEELVTKKFGTGANAFSIEFVTVGNPGNPDDSAGNPNPCGNVNYVYSIAKYEVSRDMINKANADSGLGITMRDMTASGGNGSNKPAVGICWNEAARFVNWLNSKEGAPPAYKFEKAPGEQGYSVESNVILWTQSDKGYDESNKYRNKLAKYFIPSNGEWYKAAFYNPKKSEYSVYAVESDGQSPLVVEEAKKYGKKDVHHSGLEPRPISSGKEPDGEVYGQPDEKGPADVDNAGGLSFYRTMAQGGNVCEWIETAQDGTNDAPEELRQPRGGCWNTAVKEGGCLGSKVMYYNFGPSGCNDWPGGIRVAAKTPNSSVAQGKKLETIFWAQGPEMDSYSLEPYSKELVKKAEAGDAKAQYSLGWAYYTGCKGEPVKTKGGLTIIRTILMQNTSVATDWFRKSAEQGYAEAQDKLADCYYYGHGLEKNESEAFNWNKKAAEQGFARAEYRLACIYSTGKGAPKDDKEAVKWFKRAAEHGDLDGMIQYGEHLRRGEGIAQDEKEALKWLTKAAEEGYLDGQLILGVFYARAAGGARDDDMALKWLTRAAEQGHKQAKEELRKLKEKIQAEHGYSPALVRKANSGIAEAMFDLGVCYEKGEGVAKDDKEAVKWITQAAEQGFPKAQMRLGGYFMFGRLLPKDQKEGVKWYLKAAEQGDSGAQCSLACFYSSGDGVAKDVLESTRWLAKSAEQGDAAAQGMLGANYFLGYGVPQDDREAVKWLTKAAKQGDPQGQYFLGKYYARGKGVRQDDKEAVKWYRKSAEQGFASAQFDLGVCYEEGVGVVKDKKESEKWIAKAAEQGCRPRRINPLGEGIQKTPEQKSD